MLRLRGTPASGRGGDALILSKPDPDWLVLNRVLRFRKTTQKAMRQNPQIPPPSGIPGDPDTSICMVNRSQLYGVNI